MDSDYDDMDGIHDADDRNNDNVSDDGLGRL